MSDLMSWTNLGTLAGATAAVLLVVQYLKPLLPWLHTRLLALILAVVLLEAVTAISGGAIEAYGLALLNAVLVASSAMGAYQVMFAASDAAKKSFDDGGAEAGSDEGK
jgi:hypothetical protein